MKFETSQLINNWVEKHRERCISNATAGEQFVYSFTPSGIVEVQKVHCMICGEEAIDYVE